VPGAQSDQARDLALLVVHGAEVQMQPVFPRLGEPAWVKRRPGITSGAGLISNSSGSSLTTTQPSAFAHQLPRVTGSTAATTTCSHPSLMALNLEPHTLLLPRRADPDEAGERPVASSP
jgi:hypothetical protein